MTVKNVEKEAVRAKVTVEVTRAEMEPAIQKVYKKACKNIAIPGFRKGKAPRAMIEKMYGKDVFVEDALDEMFADIYKAAVLDQELKAVGRPAVSKLDIDEAGTVTMIIETDLYPEVTLGQYKGVEVPKAEAAVTAEEVEKELARMAQTVAQVSNVDRAAQEGDTAVIDFEGFKDGVAFDGGKGESYELKLGSHSFIPGFEEQVVGMTAGEEKDINVTFPEEYHAKELAGAAVVFKVKVHEVKETAVPEMDDEFAKDVSEFDTLEELRADVEKRILSDKEAGIKNAFENAALEKAVANMTVEIPASMIDEEVEKELERFDYNLRAQGASLEQYMQMMGGNADAFKESFRPNAETTVKTNVMLNAIVDAEGIEISDEEREEEYAKIASSYQMDVEKVKELLSADELTGDLQMRKAAKLIADNAVAVAEEKKEEE